MTQRRFLGYGRQSLDDDDIAAVVETLRGDHLTQGPTVVRFEAALSERVGARHAVAVSNGTAALHLACLAAGLGPGMAALVPNVTFVATANAVTACGARVVLADIAPSTLALAPESLEDHLAGESEIAAILPVHMAGLAADMAALRARAGRRIVIEDAAHALGGRYPDGRPVGCCAHSDMTCFSFHPVKPITSGEGGAITTNDDELARRLRLLRGHGIERDPARFTSGETPEGPWICEQQSLGFNYRLSDLHAALGLSQIAKLDRFLDRRREIVARYDAAFADLPAVRPLQAADEQRARSAHHLYLLWFDFGRLGRTRTEVMNELRAAGIGSQVHYIPIARQPFYRAHLGADPSDFPRSEDYYRGCLSLPLHADLTDAEAERVIDAVTRSIVR